MTTVTPSQSAQVSYVGDGYFEVDGKKMNLNDMMCLVQSQYRDSLNSVMGEYINETNDQSKQMQALAALKAWARTAKDNQDSSHDDEGSSSKFSLPGYDGTNDYDTWCAKFGIQQSDVNPGGDSTTWKSTWDDNIANVDDALKNVQFSSDQSNLQLKNTNGYIGTSVSETSYMIRDYGQSLKGIFQ